MCLLILAWNVHPKYRLVVAANRDEYHARTAAPLAKWPAPTDILAGRDLQAGGAWFGLDRRRRFAVVTNFRELQRPRAHAPSRGNLIPSYLAQTLGPGDFFTQLASAAPAYSGFNLLLADERELWYGCNRAERFARPLPPGIYGLSNHYLDSPWPKLARVRTQFEAWLRSGNADGAAPLFDMLNDRRPPERIEPTEISSRLPAGLEQAIAAPFVLHPQYGTRCSTVLMLEPTGAFTLIERRFDPAGIASGETEFTLNETGWP